MEKPASFGREMTIEVNGKKYNGSFVTEKGFITVFAFGTSRKAQFSGGLPGPWVRLLFTEILNATKESKS